MPPKGGPYRRIVYVISYAQHGTGASCRVCQARFRSGDLR
jgi:hypothetical protein